MKRIMLKVPSIQVKNLLQKESCLGEKECRSAWLDLFLECISINGISISIDDHTRPGEERPHVSHNDSAADMRLIDKPFYHHGKSQPKHLLYEYIAIGMNEFVNGTHYEEVRKFLNKETNRLDNSEPFKPEMWKGKSLRIPVDFISMYAIGVRDGIVQAHIQLGHHIVLWGVQVYPTFKPDNVIFDKRVIEEIKKILARRRVKNTLRYCAQNNTFNHEDKFVSKIPGCRETKIPPVRFY